MSFPHFHFQSIAATFVSLLALSGTTRAAPPPFELKDNDVWVMAGDSITAQRLHTDYIEAYYRTRHPELHLHFRNSGIGGNRTTNLIARFDHDVAAWKPTIVSIELGMNDVKSQGPGASVETYIGNMKTLIGKIRAINARPVLISSSPVDDGSTKGAWKSPRCENLHPFTEALQRLAEKENITFVDQYHPLLDLWGENRRKGAELAAKRPAPEPAPGKPKLPPALISLGGDAVHTGPVGQTTMAATILKSLGATGEVSSATLSADGKVVEVKGCTISDATMADGVLRFTRLDTTGPWALPPAAGAARKLLPTTSDLSQYLLTVTGLPDGVYTVALDGRPATKVTAKQLAAGWNLAIAPPDRALAITALITRLQVPLNNAWRKASKEKDAAALATAQAEIEACEKELQALVQPAPMKVAIAR